MPEIKLTRIEQPKPAQKNPLSKGTKVVLAGVGVGLLAAGFTGSMTGWTNTGTAIDQIQILPWAKCEPNRVFYFKPQDIALLAGGVALTLASVVL